MHPSIHRTGLARAALVLLPALLLMNGCGGRPKYEPGCYLGAAVKPATRREVEAAAKDFYDHLRGGEYETAWGAAAEQLRNRVPKNQVAIAWTAIAEILTIPADMATQELAVVAIAPGTRGPQELECFDAADTTEDRRMVVTDQPLQAYLIQSARVRGVAYNFASVWFYEEKAWRVATFGAKPREVQGHDWRWWSDEARARKEKRQLRNAALLYNLAMDLLVPAPWVRPEALDQLMAEQKKLHVENLPNNRKERWVTTDSTEFFPFRSGIEVIEGGVAVKFTYEVPADADSNQVRAEAPKLVNFVQTTFPEYAEVFQAVQLEALTAGDRRPVWSGQFPLR